MSLNKTPFVTVIIPTYNRSCLLPKALESVLNQTYKNFEIIIVDDGSTDDTGLFLSELKNSRVKIFRTTNQGVAKARNLGIHESKGELIAFLDSDDFWYPDKLEEQIKHIDEKVGLVYSSFVLENCQELKVEVARFSGSVEKEFYKNPTNVIVIGGMSTAIVKKELLVEIGGFDERVPPPSEDYDLYWRLSRRTQFSYVSKPLSQILIHGSNASSSLKQYHLGTLYVINKMMKEPSLIRLFRMQIGFKAYLMLIKSYLKQGSTLDACKTLHSLLSFIIRGDFDKDAFLANYLVRQNNSG